MAASPGTKRHTRSVARLRGEQPGPLLIAIGGLHGNEPSGFEALGRVAARIAADSLSIRGDVVMLAGNVGALERGVRFVAHDLNRGWTGDRLAALRTSSPERLDAEDREQLALADEIDRALAEARGPAFLLDLHATSAPGIPFTMGGDTAEAHAFASAFPLTLVLGLLEAVNGTLASYYGKRCVAVAVEGGQNTSPETARCHEAVTWLALVASGIVAERAVPDLDTHRTGLACTRGDLPPVLRVHHRHAISAEDRFRMEPGFANIHPVAAGQLLARDERGEIRSPDEGFVMLPLYQAMGDDGFFFGREVKGESAFGFSAASRDRRPRRRRPRPR